MKRNCKKLLNTYLEIVKKGNTNLSLHVTPVAENISIHDITKGCSDIVNVYYDGHLYCPETIAEAQKTLDKYLNNRRK